MSSVCPESKHCLLMVYEQRFETAPTLRSYCCIAAGGLFGLIDREGLHSLSRLGKYNGCRFISSYQGVDIDLPVRNEGRSGKKPKLMLLRSWRPRQSRTFCCRCLAGIYYSKVGSFLEKASDYGRTATAADALLNMMRSCVGHRRYRHPLGHPAGVEKQVTQRGRSKAEAARKVINSYNMSSECCRPVCLTCYI